MCVRCCHCNHQASQIVIWISEAGLNISVCLLFHAMSSYCFFSLRHSHKQELGLMLHPPGASGNRTSLVQPQIVGAKALKMLGVNKPDELLTPGLQDAFDELMGQQRSARRVNGGSVFSMRYSSKNAVVSPNDVRRSSCFGGTGTQKRDQSSGRAAGRSSSSDDAGSNLREHLESIRPLLTSEEASALLTRVAGRMRDLSYSLKQFHADMARPACNSSHHPAIVWIQPVMNVTERNQVPELQLYLGYSLDTYGYRCTASQSCSCTSAAAALRQTLWRCTPHGCLQCTACMHTVCTAWRRMCTLHARRMCTLHAHCMRTGERRDPLQQGSTGPAFGQGRQLSGKGEDEHEWANRTR